MGGQWGPPQLQPSRPRTPGTAAHGSAAVIWPAEPTRLRAGAGFWLAKKGIGGGEKRSQMVVVGGPAFPFRPPHPGSTLSAKHGVDRW